MAPPSATHRWSPASSATHRCSHPRLPPLPQQLVYNGEVGDEHPVLDTLLAIHPSIQRYSPTLLGLHQDDSSGDSSSSSSSSPTAARAVDVAAALQQPAAATISYLEYTSVVATEAGSEAVGVVQEAVKSVTHWMVADLASERGRALASEAVAYMQEYVNASYARVALVANPTAATEQQGGSLLELMWGLASGGSYGIMDVGGGVLMCCVVLCGCVVQVASVATCLPVSSKCKCSLEACVHWHVPLCDAPGCQCCTASASVPCPDTPITAPPAGAATAAAGSD